MLFQGKVHPGNGNASWTSWDRPYMSHYEPKWFHFHVFSGHFLKEHENKPLFQLTPTNIKCSQFLVLDTHGLKEANLHLAEQQEDQFKYKLC